ncbi:hypothetical protein BS78_05G288700 [Paspalum vaginatum]|nr:hypothetical protein BS78_05G288700 [Paspalum vaginatum]
MPCLPVSHTVSVLSSRAFGNISTAGRAMAGAPEDPADPDEPFSPSVFLDLPPTPHPDESSDNLLALPFIRRMLMEEDADDSILRQQYAGHPALLQAEQTFAHILSSSAATPSSSHAATATDSSVSAGSATTDTGTFTLSPASGDVSAFADATWRPYDQDNKLLSQRQAHPDTGGDSISIRVQALPEEINRVTMDMLNLAFLKGMQEANKFLPATANNSLALLPRDNGEEEDYDDMEAEAGRRSAKLIVAPEQEESGRWPCGLSVGTSVPSGKEEEGEKAKSKSQGRPRRRRRQSSSGNEAAADLRTLLTHCAEAVSTGNRVSAAELLRQINHRASPTGDAWQRPTFNFSHMAICEATAGRNKVHIVDYGVHHGFQWPLLLGQLAAREGGPPAVRITTVDLPQPGLRPAAQIDEIGPRLTAFAGRCGLPFRFRSVVAARWDWETVRAADVGVEPDEVLVVNGLNHFGRLMGEGVDDDIESPSPRVSSSASRTAPAARRSSSHASGRRSSTTPPCST